MGISTSTTKDIYNDKVELFRIFLFVVSVNRNLISFATCLLLVDEDKRRGKQALNLLLFQAEKIAFFSWHNTAITRRKTFFL